MGGRLKAVSTRGDYRLACSPSILRGERFPRTRKLPYLATSVSAWPTGIFSAWVLAKPFKPVDRALQQLFARQRKGWVD